MRFEIIGGGGNQTSFTDSLTSIDPAGTALGPNWLLATRPFGSGISSNGGRTPKVAIAASQLDGVNCAQWTPGVGDYGAGATGWFTRAVPILVAKGLYGLSQYVQITMVHRSNPGNSVRAGIAVMDTPNRTNGAAHYHFGILQDGSYQFGKELDGAFTTYATGGAGAINDGDVLLMKANLHTSGQVALSVFQNGASLVSQTDTTSPILTGIPTMYGQDYSSGGAGAPVVEFRNFSCGPN
jgi:hypothetical protein